MQCRGGRFRRGQVDLFGKVFHQLVDGPSLNSGLFVRLLIGGSGSSSAFGGSAAKAIAIGRAAAAANNSSAAKGQRATRERVLEAC